LFCIGNVEGALEEEIMSMETSRTKSNRGLAGHGSVNRRFGPRRGGAMLETALVMGLLIMLSFGTAEYGYFFFIKNILSGAARDGARTAIADTATNATVTSSITTAMSAANISTSKYTVTLSPSDVSVATAGTAITVTITATWSTVGVTPLPVSMGGISPSKQVIGTCVMYKEQ
jgi:Flp pilus assembly protein TadG